MELNLSICTEHVQKTFRLVEHERQPDLYELMIQADFFKLCASVSLLIRYHDDTWKLWQQKPPDWEPDVNEPVLTLTMHSAAVLKTIHGEYLWIILNNSFQISTKSYFYSLKHQHNITIGRYKDNRICLSHNPYISGMHAAVKMTESGYIIESYGTNGLYLNGEKLIKTTLLQYGDVIWMFTMHLLFLKDQIMIYLADEYTTSLEELVMDDACRSEIIKLEADTNEFFHPAPRAVIPVRKEPIELEGPPGIQVYRKQSVLLTIGPAFTMAIPMILGFAIAAYASANRGQMSMGMGYSALITSVISGLFGTIWACLNLKNNKKLYQENERQRRHSYERYMQECEHKIKTIYEHNFNAMNSMYPAADVCCRYQKQSSQLWNRTNLQSDYLFFRLGIGSVPFQAKIIIPKEKFVQHADQLMEAPRMLRQKYESLNNVPIGIDCNKYRLICRPFFINQ